MFAMIQTKRTTEKAATLFLTRWVAGIFYVQVGNVGVSNRIIFPLAEDKSESDKQHGDDSCEPKLSQPLMCTPINVEGGPREDEGVAWPECPFVNRLFSRAFIGIESRACPAATFVNDQPRGKEQEEDLEHILRIPVTGIARGELKKHESKVWGDKG